MNKILDRQTLKQVLEELREQGKRIAFTNGCFDILHVGHIRYLREAKKTADILVLALNSDRSVRSIKGERRPIVPEKERADVMAALEMVDYVTVFDEDTPGELIAFLEPDVLIKGGDWSAETVVGRDVIKRRGGKIVIVPLTEGVSTTNVIGKVLEVYGTETK
ncbi:MAG: D-glycero-beta-D-manno-heptose 1-phosphate adenylyltransferase [Syntrophaceae bacterium]|nr:D-glycero-beta-D-manno-heptose 1-phosphate adenylyltransferase [Syntrophaceae bacterium]